MSGKATERHYDIYNNAELVDLLSHFIEHKMYQEAIAALVLRSGPIEALKSIWIAMDIVLTNPDLDGDGGGNAGQRLDGSLRFDHNQIQVANIVMPIIEQAFERLGLKIMSGEEADVYRQEKELASNKIN